jgi:hypothetical protein
VHVRTTWAEAVDDYCPYPRKVEVAVPHLAVGIILQPVGGWYASTPGQVVGGSVRLKVRHPEMTNVGEGFLP